MFAKIAATTAVIALTVGSVFIGAAATQTGAEAGIDNTGPCVIAVWNDDPTITSKRGNCPVEVAPVEETPAPVEEEEVVETLIFSSLTIRDPKLANMPASMKVTNTVTGKVVADAQRKINSVDGYAYWPWFEFYVDDRTQVDTYEVQLTVGESTYKYTSGPANVKPTGDYKWYGGDFTFSNGTFTQAPWTP
jgi:hypothetical protein